MYRYKQLLSRKLSLCCYNGLVGEALANVKAFNKMAGLDIPVSQPIS
jgi:hypothetical protein